MARPQIHIRVLQVATSGKLRVEAGASGEAQAHDFGWRDAMDVLVKWRQLSEPNDQARLRGACPGCPVMPLSLSAAQLW